MINTWCPIWSLIVDSSLWEEDGDVVKVFMTIIACKDSLHVCPMDAYRIANRCNFRLADGSVDEEKAVSILDILSSPDKRRKRDQEDEGRRIRAVEGGWFVINGEKYRRWVSSEMKKANNRKSQQAHRDRQKLKEATPPPKNGKPYKPVVEVEEKGCLGGKRK